jgi:hypothetical protein
MMHNAADQRQRAVGTLLYLDACGKSTSAERCIAWLNASNIGLQFPCFQTG